MLKVSGFKELERYGKKLATLPNEWPKAQASAANTAGASLRKSVLAEVKAKTGLPAQPVGRRVFLRRADARNSRKLFSKVTGYRRKFSASYHKKGETLMARQTRSGVKVGRHNFADAWIGKGKHRQFVGKRTSKSRYPIVYPSIDFGPIVDDAVKRGEPKAQRVLFSAFNDQVDKRIRKHMKVW